MNIVIQDGYITNDQNTFEINLRDISLIHVTDDTFNGVLLISFIQRDDKDNIPFIGLDYNYTTKSEVLIIKDKIMEVIQYEYTHCSM